MSELALFLVRIGFVAVLWVFILSLLSVIRADLYGRRVISRIARQNAPQLTAGSAASLGIDDSGVFEPTQIHCSLCLSFYFIFLLELYLQI